MPENKVQFEALFNHATIGIVVTNRLGEIINFNNYAEQQFGYTLNEVLGKKVEVLIPRNVHSAHERYREGFHQHPSHRKMGEGRDLHAFKKDGSVFPVEVSISSYRHEEQTFVIAFVIDITVRKKNEEMVHRQKDELELITRQITSLNSDLERKVDDRTRMLKETMAELERSKEELSEALEKEKHLGDLKSGFVTMASHEFRTPLSTILSSSYLVEQYIESGAPEKSAKHLKRIKGAVAGLKGILEDFLSLGKLEEGMIRATMENVPVEECIAVILEVITEMEQLAKNNQQIGFNYMGEHAPLLDKHLLKNILINLLSNAIKFSGAGANIFITAAFEERGFVLSVKDEGIGISGDDRQFLTERFFRARNAANIQGTGLGLHIVVKYLELMKGRMDLTSQLNEGSTFTIHIPE